MRPETWLDRLLDYPYRLGLAVLGAKLRLLDWWHKRDPAPAPCTDAAGHTWHEHMAGLIECTSCGRWRLGNGGTT